MNELVTDNFF